jgi:hypothetical protein
MRPHQPAIPPPVLTGSGSAGRSRCSSQPLQWHPVESKGTLGSSARADKCKNAGSGALALLKRFALLLLFITFKDHLTHV